MSVSVLSNVPNLIIELKTALPNLVFHHITPNSNVDITSDIVIADMDLLVKYINNLPNTKWIQGTWAGVDYILPHVNPNKPWLFKISRFTGTYFGNTMSEYVLGCIINHERDFYVLNENQKQKIWPKDGKSTNYRVISDLTIGIMGIGNIGSRIGEHLKGFGATVLGYGRSRSPKEIGDNSYLTKYYTKDTLVNFLKECDYIVNVLPHTFETTGLLNGNILKNSEVKKTVFINIGRASIISEEELVRSLNNHWISAAFLDVFITEPLPQESLLWTMEQVKITPHVAGVSKAKAIAELFRSNYELYSNGETIPSTVDVNKQY